MGTVIPECAQAHIWTQGQQTTSPAVSLWVPDISLREIPE